MKNIKNPLNILGLGPGHKDYVMPITHKYIKNSDVLIGGRRNIESLGEISNNKEIRYIDRYLDQLVDYIKECMRQDKTISLIVSGDPGFYSMTAFMVRNFSRDSINVIAGISSMQYMFASINHSYEIAFIGSVHGRECDYITPIKESKNIGLLTDNKSTPQVIAKTLIENGISKDSYIYVGERLSYDDEVITKLTLEKMQNVEKAFEINVVVVIGEKGK